MFKHTAPEQKMRMIIDAPKGVWNDKIELDKACEPSIICI